MGAGSILLLAGLTSLATILECANERVFSRLGLIGILLAVDLWVIFSVFRAVVTIHAAQELTMAGAIPGYYEPLAQWAYGLYYIYSFVGFLALAAFGVSLLQVGSYLPGADRLPLSSVLGFWFNCSSWVIRYLLSIIFHPY